MPKLNRFAIKVHCLAAVYAWPNAKCGFFASSCQSECIKCKCVRRLPSNQRKQSHGFFSLHSWKHAGSTPRLLFLVDKNISGNCENDEERSDPSHNFAYGCSACCTSVQHNRLLFTCPVSANSAARALPGPMNRPETKA